MTNKFIEQRVDELEQEISELKLIVAQIRKPSTVVEVALANVENIIEFEGKRYKKVEREAREGDVVVLQSDNIPEFCLLKKGKPYKVVIFNNTICAEHGPWSHYEVYTSNEGSFRTPETVEVYELIKQEVQHQTVPCAAVNKSNNQLRAEIIEKAKEFVDENGGDDYNFGIDADKRTVFAWKIDGEAYTGLATCSPNDVFNEDLGRAIAFGRAEGLDVSEFEQAVQPTFAVGQQIKTRKSKIGNATIYTIEKLGERSKDLSYVCDRSNSKQTASSGVLDDFYVIINDTNAIYSEVAK